MTEAATQRARIGPSEALAALFTEEGMHDPYRSYEALWTLGPVIPLGPRMTLVLGHEECSSALREPAFLVTDASIQRRAGMLDHSSWRDSFAKNMLFCNEPDHTRLRGFARYAYSARRVAGLRPMMTRLGERVVDRLASRAHDASVDLVEEFAFRFSAAVVGEVLGIPEADLTGMRDAITTCTAAFEPIVDPAGLASVDDGMRTLLDHLTGAVRERRAHPADDLIGELVRDLDASATITDEELVANLVIFVIGGVQTPSDSIGNAVRLAVAHPGPARAMAADPALASAFVTETLRFDPPIHVLTRVAAGDLDFFGTPIAADSRVLVIMAAANRDPRRFAEPDRFDVARADNQPLVFGLGPHYCLGAAFARMQLEVAVPLLLRQFPDMALAGSPVYRNQWAQRGMARMDVTPRLTMSGEGR